MVVYLVCVVLEVAKNKFELTHIVAKIFVCDKHLVLHFTYKRDN